MPSFDYLPLQSLCAASGFQKESLTISPMQGGASSRQYFRIADASVPSKTAVAMFVPEGDKPEEVDHSGKHPRWPFLEIRELLSERGVHVPSLLAEDTEKGWLLLEDLGDMTLANYLLAYPEEKRAIYTRAVRDLAKAQKKLKDLESTSVVRKRAFDFDLLHWEIEHFREWALEGRQLYFTENERNEWAMLASSIAKRVAGFERGFVHRDYQSRNLMVRGEKEQAALYWIDFQDALLGPRAYDLVALLGDSYQTFTRSFIQDMLDIYAEELSLSTEQRLALEEEFDWITVQRKLKDAGRFVFIDRVRGNPNFLEYVSPTIRKVKAALDRLQASSEARQLSALLAKILGTEFTSAS